MQPHVFKYGCSVDVVSSFMLIMNPWLCVEADVTPCLLEKEEDTCTEKVLVALFSSLLIYSLHSHFSSV